jgi:hypothetical protein
MKSTDTLCGTRVYIYLAKLFYPAVRFSTVQIIQASESKALPN